MDHSLTLEQVQFAESLSRWLSQHHDFDHWRKMDVAAVPNWPGFAEMGWLGLLVPEELEGIGQGVRDMALLAEAFGGALVREPWMSTALLGVGLINAFGTEAQRTELLPRIASGELLLALAMAEPQQRFDILPQETRLIETGGNNVLQGRKMLVLDAPVAHLVLVTARAEDGSLRIALIDPKGAGVGLTSYTTVDDRLAADIELSNVAVDQLLGTGPVDVETYDRILDQARIYLCAEGLGAMRALFRMTLDYVQNRRQFGQAIGDFQVVRHRLVDMRVAIETADAMTAGAIMAIEADSGQAAALTAAARVQIGNAAQQVGRAAVHLHGGMGMTDELAIGHYFKRLLMVETLFGDIDWNRRRFVALQG